MTKKDKTKALEDRIAALEKQNRKWVAWTGELQEKIERLEAELSRPVG